MNANGALLSNVNLWAPEEMSKALQKCEEPSSQVNRRRMLQFDSEGLDAPFCNEDASSSYLRTKERENSAEEALSEISQWVSGYADVTSASANESLDQPSEGWLASCFTDADMQISPNDLVSDVQIDIAELLDFQLEPAVNVIQQRPVRTQRNVLKGRKSYIQTSANSPSSVAYPFAFIKPCAVHGDVTLKEINQRIHAPQLKPSYDDPASHPTSAFSGKPVVGTTKIRTEGGKGCITIMRTKG